MKTYIKELISNFKAFVLVIFLLLFLISIIGQIPISKDISKSISLSNLQRIFIFIGSLLWIVIAWFADKYLGRTESLTPPKNPEWEKRLKQTNIELERIKSDPNTRKIIEENSILFKDTINGTLFNILAGNIINSDSDIIVSSDDNYLQAAGGVAKAILQAGGKIVEEELNILRKKGIIKLSYLAVSTAGNLRAKFIFHPAVIDLKRNIYPDENVIRKTVQNCLLCAKHMGLSSISFPILGGGTASKNLNSHQSFKFILEEIIIFLLNENSVFDFILLYVFNLNDAGSNIEDFINKVISANIKT